MYCTMERPGRVAGAPSRYHVTSDLEWVSPVDAEREKQLDEALARMRAAFADLSEEQILDDVAQIVERDRKERRMPTLT